MNGMMRLAMDEKNRDVQFMTTVSHPCHCNRGLVSL